MQPADGVVGYAVKPFQSSSGPAARYALELRMLFQSSSGQKAGCNAGPEAVVRDQGHVSIRIRPSGRMQPQLLLYGVGIVQVSILIRPEGRMQHLTIGETEDGSCFNPHPARRPDATFDRLLCGGAL